MSLQMRRQLHLATCGPDGSRSTLIPTVNRADANQPSSQEIGGGGGGGAATTPGLVGKRPSDSLSLAGIIGAGAAGGGASDSLQGVVSPSVMAKFLEDELKSSEALLNSPVKHCETCVCTRNSALTNQSGSLLLADLLGDGQKYYSVGTQTVIKGAETNNSLCLRCNNNLNSPSHHNSPYIMKLIKSSDSVISETKSSVSDFLTTPDKNSPNGTSSGGQIPPLIPAVVAAAAAAVPIVATKKDDLMVNPILGHHRLSDRSSSNHNSTSPNSDPLAPAASSGTSAAVALKSNNILGVNNGTGSVSKPPLKKPLDPYKSKVSSTATGASKYTSDSPSYIIKDTDQMSAGGSHVLQTPKSGVGGGEGGGGSSGPGKVTTGGSVGSGLYHAVGSTNSLWSRTSSRERDGAKIFENFNRNLIKTIKAENPKMSGPRICSLRIQNGSSNILLDSLQDDVMDDPLDIKPTGPNAPVIYTRRAKFLDEELLLDDDPSIGLNGAIKTTSLPTASSNVNTSNIGAVKQQTTAGGIGFGVGGRGIEGGHVAGDGTSKDVCNMSTTTSPHSSDRLCTIGEEVNNLLLNTKITSSAANALKPRLDISVNKLEGIDLNSKKSCTQSSSISSEIDIQESAMLRRQQLSRVAEWVQNNSKLGHPENLSNTESDSENLALASAATLTIVDSINNNNDTKHVASDMKISHSNNSSNSAAAQQPAPHAGTVLSNSSNSYSNNNNNHIISGNNNLTFAQMTTGGSAINGSTSATSRGHHSHTSLKAAIASNTAQLDYNSNSHSHRAIFGPDCPRQLSDETLPEQLYLRQQSHQDSHDLDDSSSVDLAQMEYNVKQFLLKQNEWSTISRRLSSSTTSGTIDPQQHVILDMVESTSVKKASQVGARTGGDLRGSFPGMAVAQMGTPAFNHATKYAINPHRTETNL